MEYQIWKGDSAGVRVSNMFPKSVIPIMPKEETVWRKPVVQCDNAENGNNDDNDGTAQQ